MCDCHGRLEVKELWRRSAWDGQAFPCHCLLFYLCLKVTEYLFPPFVISSRSVVLSLGARFCSVLWCWFRLCACVLSVLWQHDFKVVFMYHLLCLAVLLFVLKITFLECTRYTGTAMMFYFHFRYDTNISALRTSWYRYHATDTYFHDLFYNVEF